MYEYCQHHKKEMIKIVIIKLDFSSDVLKFRIVDS